MKAKRSAVLLSGLLLLMIFVGWAQTSDVPRPSCPPVEDSMLQSMSCPPVEDSMLQSMLVPAAWVRADWNANTSRWDIDCKQIDAIANLPAVIPVGINASRPANVLPSRRGPRSNSNYVNTNPYRPGPDTNIYPRSNSTITNVAVNSSAKPAPKPTRRP